MGATTPKTRVAIETSPFPVPRSLAGKISGETAYKTPYIIYLSKEKISIHYIVYNADERHTLLQKVYPQFQPRSELEFLAVVVANRKTAVATARFYS